jgi:hypothetical protein
MRLYNFTGKRIGIDDLGPQSTENARDGAFTRSNAAG